MINDSFENPSLAENYPEFEEIMDIIASVDHQTAYDQVLQLEVNKERTTDDSPSSCISPKATLDGMSWYQFLLERQNEKEPIRVLDLGAGTDAAHWFVDPAGLSDEGYRRARTEVPNIIVTAHTGTTFQEHLRHGDPGFRMIEGHFIPVLQKLIDNGEMFDVVLSRHALYMSIAAVQTLEMIDLLLAPRGAAFLDTVGKNRFENLAIFYPRCWDIPLLLTREAIRSSKPYRETNIFGLKWQNHRHGHDDVAWRKGEFDNYQEPKLRKMAVIHDQLNASHTLHRDLFRAVYNYSV